MGEEVVAIARVYCSSFMFPYNGLVMYTGYAGPIKGMLSAARLYSLQRLLFFAHQESILTRMKSQPVSKGDLLLLQSPTSGCTPNGTTKSFNPKLMGEWMDHREHAVWHWKWRALVRELPFLISRVSDSP
jgi:hypothetical protein